MDGFRNVSDPKLVPTSRALLDFLALEGQMDEISTDMEELANPACMFLATKATRAVFQLDSRGPEGGGLGWDFGGGDVWGRAVPSEWDNSAPSPVSPSTGSM